jgi:diguanylate cyclase (GGDEF)-like protein
MVMNSMLDVGPPTDQPASRAQLMAAAEAALRRARRTYAGVGLLFLDLDAFANVNERLGRAVGDAVLREVASQIRSRVRAQDVVARVGGDEFGVLLPETTEEGARVVGERLVRALNDLPFKFVGQPCRIGSSVGSAVALPWVAPVTAEALAETADGAMVAAKRAGKCRVVSRSLVRESERQVLDAVREQTFRTFLVRRNRVTARKVAAADDRRAPRPCLLRVARRLGWVSRPDAVRLAQAQRREGKTFEEVAVGPNGLQPDQLWTLIACRQGPPEFLASQLVRTGILSAAEAQQELAAYYEWIGSRRANGVDLSRDRTTAPA